MTEESRARTAYKQRLMESRETVLTELFGLGWPGAPHRVLWNEACERWLTRDERGPGWVRAVQALLSPVAGRLPDGAQQVLVARQSAGLPLLGPFAVTQDAPSALIDAGPLYAGQTVARIHDIVPARQIVRELAP
jgi:NAD(P)H-dependent flavin oxidoreductase YrpB (nitropropane dioxygenase family)